jgi:peptidoglycan hydrolase CwlO-like protein
MLLVLTTALSLEAIYLAIFIQMTVNANTASLREVEEDIDEIQEDVEELGEDLDEIQEDIGEIQEDVEEMSEDIDEIQEDVEELNEEDEEEVKRAVRAAELKTEAELLDKLSQDVARLLADIEAFKKGK